MKGRGKSLPTEIILDNKRRSFEQNGNPIYLLEGFLFCRESRISAPEWILNWIEIGFRKYLRNRGKRGLDQILTLNRGRGKRSWFTQKSIDERNKALIRKVIELRVKCHLLVKQACHAVWEKERQKNRSATHLIGGRRLKDIYSTRNRMKS